ncbi:response regulator [Paenibacillus lemnae]|uniref:Response regulator n=1 Tax=Paenibacillus lemnae TaxID=1330551 RepID=A0A848MC30_PAELE|nr:response regulator [Paenibacillus lemnae]NMO97602.1 response regulator [Paenibacillus lemnae]
MLQILLVDDEHYVVDDLQVAFPWTEFGIGTVHKAYSGYQAMQILQKVPVDILITDIAMPGMSGLELVNFTKENYPKTKFILLTGYSDFEYAVEALKNGVLEYLLKPLDQSKLRSALQSTILKIQEELSLSASLDRAKLAFREHLPLLKDKLLCELIQGKKYAAGELMEKLSSYQISIREQEGIYLILVRLEERFTSYGSDSQTLFEYAVINIAEEIFRDSFEIWQCRDPYEYLVFVLKHKEEEEVLDKDSVMKRLNQKAEQLHYNVNEYLKGGISVVLSYPGVFPQEVRVMYEDAVYALRQQVGNRQGYFLSVAGKPHKTSVQPLRILYESPSLIHLLETGQWHAYKERLHRIQEECDSLSGYNAEYFEEIRSLFLASFHYIAHKNQKLLSDLVGYERMQKSSFRSLDQLIGWGEELADMLRDKLETDTRSNQQKVVEEIRNFIDHSYANTSLQSAADHVSLHPSYVSKLFKQVIGVSISEYIYQVKMEQALIQLKDSDAKVYEISEQLGYANSQYFIKVFKEQFGMTPQDYREKIAACSHDAY